MCADLDVDVRSSFQRVYVCCQCVCCTGSPTCSVVREVICANPQSPVLLDLSQTPADLVEVLCLKTLQPSLQSVLCNQHLLSHGFLAHILTYTHFKVLVHIFSKIYPQTSPSPIVSSPKRLTARHLVALPSPHYTELQ